jgi:polyphosphate kinase 2 (PPK2 family)
MDNVIEESNEFEKLLASEGALILKFWLHLSK